VAAVQSEYSLWWREPERDVLRCSRSSHRLRAVQPARYGFLTGAIDENTKFDSTDPQRVPRFTAEPAKANLAFVELSARSPRAR